MIALPGIKFFIFSGIVNFVVVLLLILAIILNFKAIVISKVQVASFTVFFVFFIVTLSSGINYDVSFDFTSLFRYVSLFLSILCVAFLVSVINLKLLNILLVLWSSLLALLYWGDIIQPTGAGELSYLILSMQLGVGYAVTLGYLAFGRLNWIVRFLLSAFLLVSILSLPGRMSIILCLLLSVTAFFSYSKMNFENNNRYTVILLVGLLSTLVVYLYPIIMEHVLTDYFFYKMNLMFEGGDGRSLTYMNSISIIVDNPFGTGLHAYNSLIGFYPHNIFLEAGLNAGILGIFPLLIVAVVLFGAVGHLAYTCKVGDQDVYSIAMVALYLFLSWNTSNNLTSAYVPFSAIIISIYFLFNKITLKHAYK